jgi:Flp pilus assembly protein TadG
MITVKRGFSNRLRLAVVTGRRRASDESGATLVELALCSVILFAFVFGILEMSLAIYGYHFISDAAREGTRYAIVRGWTAPSVGGTACASYTSGACTASSAQIQQYVKSKSFPGIVQADMTVTPSWSTYPGGVACTAPSSTCNIPGNLVTVQVQYAYPISIPFMVTRTITMNSTAAMVISQ